MKKAELKQGVLSEIADIEMGTSPPGSTYNTDGIGVPLINGPTEFTRRFPIKKQWTTQPTKLCKKGDILLCVRGSSTGRINISDSTYCIGRGVAAIRTKNSDAGNGFIESVLLWRVQTILALSTGSTFPSIDKSTLSNLQIVVPPPPEQQKIAAILSTWDRAIEMTEKQIAAKQKRKQALMQQLLTGKVRYDKNNTTWETKNLGSLATFVNGRAFKPSEWRESGTPIIRIQNLNGSTDFNYFQGVSEEKHRVNPSDLLFSWSGSRGTSFGPCFWHGPEGVLNQHIFRVVPKPCVQQRYLGHALKYVTVLIERKAHGSAGLVHVTKKELERYTISIPKPPIQEKIAAVLDNASSEILLLTRKFSALKQQKAALMQQLLTGRIRVRPYEVAAP